MKITIDFIPHLEQRYNTCGDWVFDQNGDLNIKISDTSDTDHRFSHLVAIHELIEALLCLESGVTTQDVDAFDHEALQKHPDVEPGDLPSAPYYEEHQVATGVERILAAQMGVMWLAYENELSELTEEYNADHE